MLTTTTLSLADAPVTVVTENTSYLSHLRHALIIDLDLASKPDHTKYLPSFLGHLRTVATQPIDTLHFLRGTPTSAIWEALQDQKSIAHLEMISGYDEYCNIGPLDQVGSSWPLKSIVIGGACGEDIKTSHINSIDSLTLDYCCGMSFSLATPNSSSQLRPLSIVENDACDHFIKLQEETSLLNNLSELRIVSTNGCDFCHQYEEKSFGDALVQCHSVTLLDLTLNVTSTETGETNYLIELSTFFPPNLETVRFRGPPLLANDLSIWCRCVSDSKWLPNLKSIQFSLDVFRPDEKDTVEKASLAQEQSTNYLNHLASLRPSVTIVTKFNSLF